MSKRTEIGYSEIAAFSITWCSNQHLNFIGKVSTSSFVRFLLDTIPIRFDVETIVSLYFDFSNRVFHYVAAVGIKICQLRCMYIENKIDF